MIIEGHNIIVSYAATCNMHYWKIVKPVESLSGKVPFSYHPQRGDSKSESFESKSSAIAGTHASDRRRTG